MKVATARSLANFVLFQAGWFLCVLGASRRWPFASVAAGPAMLAVTALLSRRPWRTVMMVLVCTGLGVLIDGSLIVRGFVQVPPGAPAVAGVPLWIGSLWLLFASTFDGSLRWLTGRPMLAFVFGAVGSPLSYLAAQRLGAVSLRPGFSTLAVIGTAWGVLMVVQLWIAPRIVYGRLGRPRQAEGAPS